MNGPGPGDDWLSDYVPPPSSQSLRQPGGGGQFINWLGLLDPAARHRVRQTLAGAAENVLDLARKSTPYGPDTRGQKNIESLVNWIGGGPAATPADSMARSGGSALVNGYYAADAAPHVIEALKAGGPKALESLMGVLKNERGGAVMARPSAAEKILAHSGGATLDARTLEPTTGTGFSVADPRFTRTFAAGEDQQQALNQWLRDPATRKRLQQQGAHIGVWRDPESGQLEVNVSDFPVAEQTARRLGVARGQKALGQLVNGVYQGDVPLPGLRPGAVPEIAQLFGDELGGTIPTALPKVDPARGAEMAKAYEALPVSQAHAQPAYDALNREIAKQKAALENAGYRFEFVDHDPYKNSQEMLADVRDNKRLKVLKTNPESAHPYMTPQQNDDFRAVHDMTHAAGGFPFGPAGEEATAQLHASTMPRQAQQALLTETRGQNSWVNFGPNAHLPPAERPFAPQKASLWPEEYMGPGGTPAVEIAGRPITPRDPLAVMARLRPYQYQGGPQSAFSLAPGAGPDLGPITPQEQAADIAAKTSSALHGVQLDEMARASGRKPKLLPAPDRTARDRVFSMDMESLHSEPYDLPSLYPESGATRPSVLGGTVIGGGAGAYAGSQVGDTPQERARNALLGLGIGMAAGGAAGPAAEQLNEVGRLGAQMTLPEQKPLEYFLGPKTDPRKILDAYSQARETFDFRGPFGTYLRRGSTFPGAARWYDTRPIYQAAADVLGDEAGTKRVNDLLGGYMPASTARSAPPNNLKRAFLWQSLVDKGLVSPSVLRANKVIPAEGFGHFAQNAHQAALARFLETGEINPAANPKPASFGENLTGNQEPATFDTVMGDVARKINPGIQRYFSGEAPFSWAYEPLERGLAHAAHDAAQAGVIEPSPGLSPVAAYQSLGWHGATRSAQYGSMGDIFNKLVSKSAEMWGVSPAEANRLIWTGQTPLLPLGASPLQGLVPR